MSYPTRQWWTEKCHRIDELRTCVAVESSCTDKIRVKHFVNGRCPLDFSTHAVHVSCSAKCQWVKGKKKSTANNNNNSNNAKWMSDDYLHLNNFDLFVRIPFTQFGHTTTTIFDEFVNFQFMRCHSSRIEWYRIHLMR